MSRKLEGRVRKAHLDTLQRHVLVCVDGDCGGKAVAKAMRKAVADAGLRATVSVAKVDCLDVCTKGTIAVVYPEGTWYAHLDEAAARRVVAEHLRDGEVIEDLVFHRNPLDAARRAPGAHRRS